MARINVKLILDKSAVETMDKLRGEVKRDKYVQSALKFYNRRMQKKNKATEFNFMAHEVTDQVVQDIVAFKDNKSAYLSPALGAV